MYNNLSYDFLNCFSLTHPFVCFQRDQNFHSEKKLEIQWQVGLVLRPTGSSSWLLHGQKADIVDLNPVSSLFWVQNQCVSFKSGEQEVVVTPTIKTTGITHQHDCRSVFWTEKNLLNYAHFTYMLFMPKSIWLSNIWQ